MQRELEDFSRLSELTKLAKVDTASARAASDAAGNGEVSKAKRVERVARDARLIARRAEVSQMLRDKEVARATARAELEHIRVGIE